MIHRALMFLQGKKGILGTVFGLLIGYLGMKGIIGEAEFTLLGGLSTVFFGSASLATKRMLEKNGR